MFLGEIKQAIEENGALVLPSPYFTALASGLIVTRGFDRNLMLFAKDEWQQLAHKILNRPLSHHEVRNFRRHVFSNATLLRADEDGRIFIPRSLRDFAELEGEVVISGMYDFLEIWNSESWRLVNKTMDNEKNGLVWKNVGI